MVRHKDWSTREDWEICLGPECTRPAVSKGVCAAHFLQRQRRGNDLKPLITRRTFKPENGFLTLDGYRVIFRPGHPNANRSGQIFEHVFVMAESLPEGRVPKGVTVHHKNTNRSDNRLENLQMRIGQHGRGGAMQCVDCGSDRVIPVDLPESCPSSQTVIS